MTLQLLGHEVTAVVFDFDGVLVDTAHGWAVAEAALCSAYGVEYTAELAGLTHGVGIEDATAVLTQDALSGRDLAAAVVLMRRLANLHVPTGARALTAAHDALALIGRHVPVAVASNSERELLVLLLEATGLAELVGTVVSASDVAAPKPAPDVYLAATDRLGSPPHTTLVVEDSSTGAAAAAAAGCPVAYLAPDTPGAPVPAVPGRVTTVRGHLDLLAQLGLATSPSDVLDRSESRP